MQAMLPRPPPGRHAHAEQAAVETHAAFPDAEHLQWIGQVGRQVVEQDVAQAAAQDHAEHAVEQQVAERGLAGSGQAPLADALATQPPGGGRSEEHTSELQSLMRISYAVFCLKKKKQSKKHNTSHKLD